MRVKSVQYADPHGAGWSLEKIDLKDGVNLCVGASGSGKTRFLNILFNIGVFAASDRFANGQWTMHFEHSGVMYTWTYDGIRDADRVAKVLSERLWIGTPDHVETSLFTRSETEFFCGEMKIPKLASSSTAIFLLREDETIKPVYQAFSQIMRRSFSGEDLTKAVRLEAPPPSLLKMLQKRAGSQGMFGIDVSLHIHLSILHQYFKSQFELISEHFRRVFPFVESIEIGKAAEAFDVLLSSEAPVVLIKERGIQQRITLDQVSSGMQKVLLIITDVISSPPDILYMVDEYENSLGANAIDFLPPFLAECGGGRQFVVTTHHPLLINAIPVSDWFLFHRKGLNIRVEHGEAMETRYGRSKQLRFTQLLNDPLYAEGIE